jgi:hypothetical protein
MARDEMIRKLINELVCESSNPFRFDYVDRRGSRHGNIRSFCRTIQYLDVSVHWSYLTFHTSVLFFLEKDTEQKHK